NLRRIRHIGRKRWKIEAGYHRRSLAETAVFRFKTIFGNTLSSRTLTRQVTEARVKAVALNRMTQLGMPDSYRVI
ncbi:MAG: IS5/IS1182 family transposase, partial [Aggregatilineales bacterium]